MSKIGLIIKREYGTRVRKMSFIIMTILGPILFAGLMIGTVYLGTLDNTEHEVLIVDQDRLITKNVKGNIVPKFRENYKETTNVRYHFRNEMISDSTFKNSVYTLMVDINGETMSKGLCYLTYQKAPSLAVKNKINSDLEKSIEAIKVTEKLNVEWEKYKAMKVNLSFIEQDIDKIGVEENLSAKAGIGFVFAIIIYFFIFLYGTQVMRGVIEEKTNRIVEVLISSVKPFDLMMGKVVGIGMVGLTQFLVWVILGSLLTLLGLGMFSGDLLGSGMMGGGVMPEEMIENAELSASIGQVSDIIFSINWPLQIFVFVFYFIGGFLLYGSLFAAIGSAVDSETDSQQFMLPMTIPLVFGFYISQMAMMNPEGPAGFWGSIVPLTSPVVMMVRTAMFGTENLWSLILSMVLLVATFIGVIWLAGKIYRTGILMYGKKASYKEIWKWLKYKA